MTLIDRDPHERVFWTDPVTGKAGYLVVDSLAFGLCTGGTRMRAGCTLKEVEDLARGMTLKAAVFGLPVGGAKGGIDCDPKDPDARGVLLRFVQHMRPWIDQHWVTAEDLGVPQHLIDDVFAEAGLGQSYHAAISKAADPVATLARVNAGLHSPVPGGHQLGDMVGGYGVAQSCLGVMNAWSWMPGDTTIAIQGMGTMGGAAALYLHEAGAKVVTVADAVGTLHHPDGLDIPALLDARDRFGEIDRALVPDDVQRLPRSAVLAADVDLLVPAAVSYAITAENVDQVVAQVVVEAANSATTLEAEVSLAKRDIPVIPDFVANAGAVVWAWWLLLGTVDADPVDTFSKLSQEMHAKVALLMAEWDAEWVTPRVTAWRLADLQVSEYDAGRLVVIP